MRSGRLLAEDSPHSLLNSFMLSSLEDVFLKLCVKESANAEVPVSSRVFLSLLCNILFHSCRNRITKGIKVPVALNTQFSTDNKNILSKLFAVTLLDSLSFLPSWARDNTAATT